MSPKQKFLSFVRAIKQKEIVNRIYSVKDPEELKGVWQDFQNENKKLISKIRDWEAKYLDSSEEAYDIFNERENIEDAMEIAICIRLMSCGGREIYIFENEYVLSDALGKINNYFAKRVSILSYENVLSEIKAEDIFKRS